MAVIRSPGRLSGCPLSGKLPLNLDESTAISYLGRSQKLAKRFRLAAIDKDSPEKRKIENLVFWQAHEKSCQSYCCRPPNCIAALIRVTIRTIQTTRL